VRERTGFAKYDRREAFKIIKHLRDSSNISSSDVEQYLRECTEGSARMWLEQWRANRERGSALASDALVMLLWQKIEQESQTNGSSRGYRAARVVKTAFECQSALLCYEGDLIENCPPLRNITKSLTGRDVIVLCREVLKFSRRVTVGILDERDDIKAHAMLGPLSRFYATTVFESEESLSYHLTEEEDYDVILRLMQDLTE
jgi:hypothetical protein